MELINIFIIIIVADRHMTAIGSLKSSHGRTFLKVFSPKSQKRIFSIINQVTRGQHDLYRRASLQRRCLKNYEIGTRKTLVCYSAHIIGKSY